MSLCLYLRSELSRSVKFEVPEIPTTTASEGEGVTAEPVESTTDTAEPAQPVGTQDEHKHREEL